MIFGWKLILLSGNILITNQYMFGWWITSELFFMNYDIVILVLTNPKSDEDHKHHHYLSFLYAFQVSWRHFCGWFLVHVRMFLNINFQVQHISSTCWKFMPWILKVLAQPILDLYQLTMSKCRKIIVKKCLVNVQEKLVGNNATTPRLVDINTLFVSIRLKCLWLYIFHWYHLHRWSIRVRSHSNQLVLGAQVVSFLVDTFTQDGRNCLLMKDCHHSQTQLISMSHLEPADFGLWNIAKFTCLMHTKIL